MTLTSKTLWERLERLMPGGETRTGTFYAPHPVAMERGEGYTLWDVEGNSYVDLSNNNTALVHGHAHPEVTAAIAAQAARGVAFPSPTTLQAEVAERLTARFESIDRLRFTNSGSEAVMMALRAARGFTGRELVVKADGGYHGSWEQVPMSWTVLHGRVGDALEASQAHGDAPDGIPSAVRALGHMVEYNNAADLERLMDARGDEIAAVVLEPVLGEGMIPGDAAYFTRARELCDRHGALLVLDEVVTARLDLHGHQSTLGVRPDLTVLGKIIGGGLPVGAFGGRQDVMAQFDPRGAHPMGHAGTCNGNPLTLAAGRAALDLLDEAEIRRINALGDRLAEGFQEALTAAGTNGRITSCGSLVHVHFDTGPTLVSFKGMNLASRTLTRFHRACLDEGVVFAPRGTINVSTPMDEGVIDDVLDRVGRAAERIGAG